MTENKTEKGRAARKSGYFAEMKAVLFLRLKGYRILERDFKPPRGSGAGEIDIVALKGETLVFVEVKKRAAGKDAAAFAVTPAVRRRRVKGAEYYLAVHPEYAGRAVRFDAVLCGAAGVPQIIENAWQAESF